MVPDDSVGSQAGLARLITRPGVDPSAGRRSGDGGSRSPAANVPHTGNAEHAQGKEAEIPGRDAHV